MLGLVTGFSQCYLAVGKDMHRGTSAPLDRNKVRSIAVLGRMAQGVPPTGFGSSFVMAIRSVSELSGIQGQAAQNVKVDFIDAGTPNPATAVWEFLDSAGFVEAGLQARYFDSNDLSGPPKVNIHPRGRCLER